MLVREPFVSSKRETGQSDKDVILALVSPLSYGTVIPYDRLIAALDAGAERSHVRKDVQMVVNMVSKGALLADHQKTLIAVKNVGYQVAHPEDHVRIAQHRTKKAYNQARDASHTLRNTDTSSLSESAKAMHMLQCVVNEGLLAESRKHRRQQKANERMFARLTHRLEQIEGDVASLKGDNLQP